jgi:hypothetical protein
MEISHIALTSLNRLQDKPILASLASGESLSLGPSQRRRFLLLGGTNVPFTLHFDAFSYPLSSEVGLVN